MSINYNGDYVKCTQCKSTRDSDECKEIRRKEDLKQDDHGCGKKEGD